MAMLYFEQLLISKRGNQMKFDFKRQRVLKIIRTLAALAILIFVVCGPSDLKDEVVHGTGIVMGQEYVFTPFLNTPDDTVMQMFRPVNKNLSSISIRVANEWPDNVDNVLEFSILDPAGSVLYKTWVNSADIKNWHYVEITPDINFSVSKDYILKISCPETNSPDVCWKIFLCNGKLRENGTLTFNEEEIDGELDLMYTYHPFQLGSFLFIVAACLALLVLTWIEIPFLKKPAFGWYVTLPVTAGITLVMVEYLSSEDLGLLLPAAGIVNYLFILGLMIGLGVISGFSTLGGRIFVLLLPFLALVNHFTLQFRGTVILPSDLYSIGTAADVSGNYTILFNRQILYCMVICLAVLVILMKTEQNGRFRRHRAAGALCGILAVFPLIFLSVDPVFAEKVKLEPDQFNQTKRSHEIGFILNLGENFRFLFLTKPSGYHDETADLILKKAADAMQDLPAENQAERPDNIILIMNESLTDLRMLGDLKTDEEYLTNFYRAAESRNSKIGECAVSVFGGGTSCSEFEALTGMSMIFLGSGNAPYQQFIHKNTESLATAFEGLGYDTFAVHAGNPKNWNRNDGYRFLGFDRFISEEDEEFEDPVYCRCWISDQTMMDVVMDLYKDDDVPEFSFALTIHCHGGYDYEPYEPMVHAVSLSEEYPWADQYLSLVKETDDAFGSLIDDLSESKEKTIVLMFGDHLPGISSEFYSELSAGWTDSSEEKELQMYETPYIFWANYDVDFSDIPDEMSANFLGAYLMKTAGLPLDPYNSYLYQLSKEYPVICRAAIKDAGGVFYEYSPESACYDRLHEYEIVQYQRLAR